MTGRTSTAYCENRAQADGDQRDGLQHARHAKQPRRVVACAQYGQRKLQRRNQREIQQDDQRGVAPARAVGPQVLEREAGVDRHVQAEGRHVCEVREKRAIANREEHQAAPHHQHDHAAEIHAIGELFTAQLGGELTGIEQRQVDVHRSLRGEAQVVSAFAVGRQRERKQEVAMVDIARAERLAIAGRVDLPAVRVRLEQIQQVDERIVLSQIDQTAHVRRITQRDSYPPGGR